MRQSSCKGCHILDEDERTRILCGGREVALYLTGQPSVPVLFPLAVDGESGNLRMVLGRKRKCSRCCLEGRKNHIQSTRKELGDVLIPEKKVQAVSLSLCPQIFREIEIRRI